LTGASQHEGSVFDDKRYYSPLKPGEDCCALELGDAHEATEFIALLGALAPVRCLGEDSNYLPYSRPQQTSAASDTTPAGIDEAFGTFVKQQIGALVIHADASGIGGLQSAKRHAWVFVISPAAATPALPSMVTKAPPHY